jgi:NadR type nicotinamide-nucleotide adenylyltransferase
MQEPKKIVIIGAESTGKSSLAKDLAAHYNTVWCPEYAREYLLKNGKNYCYNDLLDIAKGQIDLEGELLSNVQNELYFIDTNMLVMKVWCEVAFDDCHKWILKQIAERKYDYYLLCNIDLPWVADELREYPDLKMRQKLHAMYRDLLIYGDTPWHEISGTLDQRLRSAVKVIDDIIE